MKLARHEKIIELIKEYDIDTQEELAARLNEAGFKVTQATVSRDIRALKMTKVAGKDGKSRYAILQDTQPGLGDQYTRVLNDAVVSIEVGQNLVVIKTVTGMAMGVATALDALKWPEILGCIAGLCKDKLPDAVIRVLYSVGISMPGYVIASGLMILLAVNLKVLPVNYNKPGGWLMPMLTLAIYPTSYLTRLTRASILEVMNQDYLRTERAKGMSEFVVVFIHALKNSLIPVITYLGPLTASILTGGFVAESVFSVPGLGRYFVSSISSRDYTMIMGVTIFYSALIVFMNLICDILYKIVDPRIQLD